MKPNSSLVEELTRLINQFYEHGYIETARLLEQARAVALLREKEILIRLLPTKKRDHFSHIRSHYHVNSTVFYNNKSRRTLGFTKS
jgi:hypothetical protein